ncbi:MAG: CPBP family intramembrane metalloprotease [Nocardioidaceae bacterium]|nr:CPBP family intramembrane metalloprotease [Nocardioidaceae bacterium]
MRSASTVQPGSPADESRSSQPQYSLGRILAIWAAATVPMGLLAFVAAPRLIAGSDLHPGLVYWMLMVVGMIWQFGLSVLVLHGELGTLRWAAVKARVWMNAPVDPHSGRPRWRLWWWVVPAIAANVVGGLAATRLDEAWVRWFPALAEPSYTRIQALASDRFEGQWWILGLALVSSLFNYVLGEELLFRGVLLPRMNGVFGRWDWVANAVLFGLYHVHKIWFWPSMVLSSFGTSWAARRYRSMWMGVVVHGVEGFYVVLVLAVVAGWYS